MNRSIDIDFPNPPKAFDDMIESTLAGIAQSEKEAQRRGRMRTGLIVLAATMILSLAVVAVAFSGRVFTLGGRYLQPEYLAVQESAYPLVKTDLGALELEHVSIKVLEAIYDGQELRVVYSLTDRAATEPFTGDEMETEANFGKLIEVARLDGVALHDGLEIDGQYANPYVTDMVNGENPGEMIFYTQVSTLLDDIQTQGEFDVKLNFWNFDFREDEAEQAKREIVFTLNADEAKPYEKMLAPFTAEIGGMEMTLNRALFTPMRGYMILEISAEGVTDGWDIEPMLEEIGFSMFGGWKILAPDGTEMNSWVEGYGPSRENPSAMQMYMMVVPPAEWPETIRLVSTDEEGNVNDAFSVEMTLE